MLIKNISTNHHEVIEKKIAEINHLLSAPFVVDSSAFKLNCSMGYAIFPQQSRTVNSLIKFADIAMNEAKNAKTLQGIQYRNSMSEKINKRLL